jgi:D-beta-D-heptose 7-phosphate kinase/D-beta-D-heptose 1-phosphate adenosyltransferase
VAEHCLLDLVANLPRARVLVVGDLVLDRYTWGRVARVSPEAPVMVLEADRRESRLGGAANVALSLARLDCSATCLGVVGNDSDGQMLADLLADAGVDAEGLLTDPSRPTTTKERFVGRAGGQHPSQVLRVDTEDRTLIASWLEDALLRHIARDLPRYDLLLISDYGKGVCTPRVLETLIATARSAEIPVLVDPRRTDDWTTYRGATLLKVNRGEAEAASGVEFVQPQDALTFGRKLCETYELQAMAITLAGDGTAVVRRSGEGRIVPTERREVYDVTGAGDMVMAILGACLASGIDLFVAADLVNAAVAAKLDRAGSVALTRAELIEHLARQRVLRLSRDRGWQAVVAALEGETAAAGVAGRIDAQDSARLEITHEKKRAL